MIVVITVVESVAVVECSCNHVIMMTMINTDDCHHCCPPLPSVATAGRSGGPGLRLRRKLRSREVGNVDPPAGGGFQPREFCGRGTHPKKSPMAGPRRHLHRAAWMRCGNARASAALAHGGARQRWHAALQRSQHRRPRRLRPLWMLLLKPFLAPRHPTTTE